MSDTSIYDKQLAWKQLGQRKVESVIVSRSHELRAQHEHECTFSPKTNIRSMRTENGESAETTPVTAAEIEAALVHPTESQESSILQHLARQGRAREHAQEAQQKLLGVQHGKDYTKCTTVEPFALSSTNWKPRQSTMDSPEHLPGGNDGHNKRSNSLKGDKHKAKAPPTNAQGSTKSSWGMQLSGGVATADKTWESERTTLISIIDAQRQELTLREQAQQEAVHVAERFAAATQAFEERLVAVEQSTVNELEEVKRLLAGQAAAIDLILTSLGIARR